MKIKLAKFSGIAPGVATRLLADTFAQTAQNIDFEAGVITPIKNDVDSFTLYNSSRRSIFYYNDANWLEWNTEDIKAAKGPIPNDTYDRVYFTGDTYPRMGTAISMISGAVGYPAASYRLGVPAPAAAPGVSKSGSVATDETANTVTYVYTFVTVYGEEGPPSPPSAALDVTTTEDVAVSMLSAYHPGGNYNFGSGALKRIYRSNTGSETTAYQFVAEVAFATETYNDTTPSSELAEVLPSDTWIGPPDDNTSLYPDGPLVGLISLANGIMAGFTGNRLCLSEPYLPHAWPAQYRKTLEHDIVAIAATSNGVIVTTTGTPYFVTGVDPSAMSATKVPVAQSCINARSLVDMGEYALYAGPDGLVKVGNGDGAVVTRGLISPAQWIADFKPDIIRAFEHEGTYVAFWWSGGVQGGWVYDPRNEEGTLSTLLLSTEVRGGWMNPDDGQLYIIVGNKIKKYRGGTTPLTATWKSKKFITPRPASFGWVGIDADAYPVEVKVWADGTLIAHYSLSLSGTDFTQTTTVPADISTLAIGSRPIMRLPAIVGQEWEVQVAGAVTINEVILAQSIQEIAETA